MQTIDCGYNPPRANKIQAVVEIDCGHNPSEQLAVDGETVEQEKPEARAKAAKK